jgi:hypothetical protein
MGMASGPNRTAQRRGQPGLARIRTGSRWLEKTWIGLAATMAAVAGFLETVVGEACDLLGHSMGWCCPSPLRHLSSSDR